MAGQKISTLPPVNELQDTDQFVLARSGSSYKITGDRIASKTQVNALSAVVATKTELAALTTRVNTLSTSSNASYALKTDLMALSSVPFIASDTATIDLTLTNRSLSAVVVNSSITNSKLAFDGGSFAFRNRLINGNFNIDQRYAGSPVNTVNGYVVDRWAVYQSTLGKLIAFQETENIPAGFNNAINIISQSNYTVSTTDSYTLCQPIEGINIADLNWGTSNASSVTLSFWVKSNLSGTYGGSVRNNATGNNTRSYPFSYTIITPSTWERKTITIPGSTGGLWKTNSDVGMYLCFGLGVGAAISGPAGSWSSNSYMSTIGATSLVRLNGTSMSFTGIQLEKGTSATAYDYRPHAVELSLCQRYYYRYQGSSAGMAVVYTDGITTAHTTGIRYPVPMRSTPTANGPVSFAIMKYLALNGTEIGSTETLRGIPANNEYFNIEAKGAGYTTTNGQIVYVDPVNVFNTLRFDAEL
jgi:hypothetical protein